MMPSSLNLADCCRRFEEGETVDLKNITLSRAYYEVQNGFEGEPEHKLRLIGSPDGFKCPDGEIFATVKEAVKHVHGNCNFRVNQEIEEDCNEQIDVTDVARNFIGPAHNLYMDHEDNHCAILGDLHPQRKKTLVVEFAKVTRHGPS